MTKFRKTFVMGDIHGAYKALMQCVERSGYNPATDRLIQLGDVADGWPEVYECVEYLRNLPHLVAIQGNHDEWALDWLVKCGTVAPKLSLMLNNHREMGGKATYESYLRNCARVPLWHIDFFKSQMPVFRDIDGNVFVHGGFNPLYSIAEQMSRKHIFLWDRALLNHAQLFNRVNLERIETCDEDIKEIFIGHTQTTTCKPGHYCNLWNLDTGAGWNGVLTIMDLETKEYWQSDNVLDLYPGVDGRYKMK